MIDRFNTNRPEYSQCPIQPRDTPDYCSFAKELSDMVDPIYFMKNRVI